MIVEFPAPQMRRRGGPGSACAHGEGTSALRQLCGHAPRHAFYDLNGAATIYGVGFFDRPHATGRSKRPSGEDVSMSGQ